MSRKLLLADDSITIQKVIGITFVNEDYDLSVVDNGDAALEKAQAERPDLILADVFMPGKNGYELCAAVKSDPALAGVPVLLLTGTFEPFDEGKAKSAGADGWIAKPFESLTLLNRVQELLDKTSAPLATPAAPQAMVEPAAEEIESLETAESVSETEPEVDLWEDFDQVAAPADEPSEVAAVVEEVAEAADFGDIFGPEEEEASAEETADDIWGDVSFEDEDLVSAPETVKGSDLDDIWATQDEVAAAPLQSAAEEETFIFDLEPEAVAEPEIGEPSSAETEDENVFIFEAEEEIEGVASADTLADEDLLVFEEEPPAELPEATESVEEPFEEELMELGEEDIMLLEEAEILDEEDLGFGSVAETSDDVFLFEEEEISPSASVESSTLSDENIFGDIASAPEPELVIPEPEPVSAEAESVFAEPEPVFAEPEPVFAEPEPVFAEPEPVFAEPEPAIPAAAQAAAVEARVQALTDEELEAIVAKVAGSVIERLAGTLLEKIAWEVVPDLAESLIKEELRQIKEDIR